MWSVAVMFALLPVVAPSPGAQAPAAAEAAMVSVEFVVEDVQGKPIKDIAAKDVVLLQDDERQTLLELRGVAGRDGHYEARYSPTSGKAGGVMLRMLRRGANVRAPKGTALRPQFVPAATPLEAELARLVETTPDAHDLTTAVRILRFEAAPNGLHHTFAIEVPLSELRAQSGGGRLQLLLSVHEPGGRTLQRFSLDHPVDLASDVAMAQRLIWTADLHLEPGRYVLNTVARDAIAARQTVRVVPFEVAPAPAGLRLSSVALLQPTTALLLRPRHDDDPLFLSDAALMPTLDVVLPVATSAAVRFFVTLYPDAASKDSPSLTLELLRDGNPVGRIAIPLPPPNTQNEIRYAGGLPTQSFPAAAYTLRLVAQQGSQAASEDVPFTITAEAQKPQLRFGGGDTGKH